MEYSEARRLGLRRYNTGRPCRKGHLAERVTSTRTCRACQYEAMKKWVAENPEKHRGHGRNWIKKRKAYGYDEKARERMRAYYRKKNGVPPAPYPAPAACENCKKVFDGGRDTHLDHDHITGKFRGWLCNRCNRGLGYFDDCIAGLEQALEYLRRTL